MSPEMTTPWVSPNSSFTSTFNQRLGLSGLYKKLKVYQAVKWFADVHCLMVEELSYFVGWLAEEARQLVERGSVDRLASDKLGLPPTHNGSTNAPMWSSWQ